MHEHPAGEIGEEVQSLAQFLLSRMEGHDTAHCLFMCLC